MRHLAPIGGGPRGGGRGPAVAAAWVGRGAAAGRSFRIAVVALLDSPRLDAFYAQVAAELRLAFGLLPDPELLHEPFIAENAAILAAVERGDVSDAASLLTTYLDRSERVVLAAFARLDDAAAPSAPRRRP